MSDLVERLRADARLLRGDTVTPDIFPDLMDQAADRIQALEAELVEARGVIGVFARCPTHGKHGGPFVIAFAQYEDMTKGSSAPREAYWHATDFDRARAFLTKQETV